MVGGMGQVECNRNIERMHSKIPFIYNIYKGNFITYAIRNLDITALIKTTVHASIVSNIKNHSIGNFIMRGLIITAM